MHRLVLVLVLSACSGATEAPVVTMPTEITPIASALAPSSTGLGRVADDPEVICTETRASVPVAEDATFTECRGDADCTAGRNGRCLRVSNHGSHGPAHEATTCSYDSCFRDADCGDPRGACYCGRRSETDPGMGHSCTTGECATDADCGASRYCRRGPSGRYCHSPADRCVDETACGDGMHCARGADGIWACMPFSAPTG